MTDIKAQNQPFYWGTLFLRSLFRSGVRHLVISPGSRSTPLTLAAAVFPGFRKQVILDERSAAFTALGIGKTANRPAALICTSGTAVANYFPAVIEARKSSVPLLMLTADRPPRLHGTGANQTIDQQHIFGAYPVFFQDAGEPAMNDKDPENLEMLASQAVTASINKQGPVHLNFPFSKPLEPDEEFVEAITKENKELDDLSAAAGPEIDGSPSALTSKDVGSPSASKTGNSPSSVVSKTESSPPSDAPINSSTSPSIPPKTDKAPSSTISGAGFKEFRFDDNLRQTIQSADHPLVIIGQLAPATESTPIFRLAEALHAPVLSEQGVSHFNCIEGFEGFLRDPKHFVSLDTGAPNKLEPDLILRFGRQPAGKSLLQAIERWAPCRHIHFSDTEYRSDIAGTTTDHLSWKGNPFSTADLFDSTENSSTASVETPHRAPPRDRQTDAPKRRPQNRGAVESSRWLDRWKEQEKKYFERSGHILDTQQTLTDGHIYHHLAPAIPDKWFTFFSNSFPVRDRSMFGRWSAQRVFTNRGASGIDGITSTAIGIDIGSRRTGILFTGDLAFLHDTNALLNKKVLQQPLVVVVINNRGGSIFRMLPVADHKAHFNTYFETPQQADITALAATYGIDAQTITTIDDLRQLNLEKVVTRSDSMLHVIECQTDPDASMQVRHELWGMNDE